MAQRILELAAEEAPERLQEALQSLGESEVSGSPAGWALCAEERGVCAAGPCQPGGGDFSLGEVQLTASRSLCSWATW